MNTIIENEAGTTAAPAFKAKTFNIHAEQALKINQSVSRLQEAVEISNVMAKLVTEHFENVAFSKYPHLDEEEDRKMCMEISLLRGHIMEHLQDASNAVGDAINPIFNLPPRQGSAAS